MELTFNNLQDKDCSLEFQRVQMLEELFGECMSNLWRKRNKERQVKESDIAILRYQDTDEAYNRYRGAYEILKVTRYRLGVIKFCSKTNELELFTADNRFVGIVHQCNPAVIAPIELDWQQLAKDLLAMKDRKAQEHIEEQRRIEEARKAEQERLRLEEEERLRKIEEERQAEEERLNSPANITVRQYEELIKRIEALENEMHDCVHYRNTLED